MVLVGVFCCIGCLTWLTALVKYGRDEELEELANQLLRDSVGDNKRSVDRDAEKMAYQAGRVTFDDLRHYDPRNDWDTLDSGFSVVIDPRDVDGIEPTICAFDDNVRARNPALQERGDLMRHVGDDDNWGPTREEIPLLGINEGRRKVCTRCKRSKGVAFFSPRSGRKCGLQSWCKECRKEVESRNRKKST